MKQQTILSTTNILTRQLFQKKNLQHITLVFCLLLPLSCTHLDSVSTTSIPVNRSNKVSTQNYRFIFFFFNFNNNYVNEMVENLAQKCPDGKIEGLLTKQESITYFPIIATAVQVSAEGYCVK